MPPFIYSRIAQGRYPGKGMPADPDAEVPGMVWGDVNAPLITNYIYSDFIEASRPGYKLHRQASGLADNAESRQFVSKESYESSRARCRKDKERRMVNAAFGIGIDEDGFPISSIAPTMKVVQGGFTAMKNIHDSRDHVQFVKNKFSHVHEGGQYLCYACAATPASSTTPAEQAGRATWCRSGAARGR